MPRLNEDEWDIVIFADTICDLDGKIIEKASSSEEAATMLRSLSGRWHLVHTCVHIVAKSKNK
jgi:septum formation protein